MSLEQAFEEQTPCNGSTTTTVFKGDIQFKVGDENILASDLATIDQVNAALEEIKGSTGTSDTVSCKQLIINDKPITGVYSLEDDSTDTYIYTQGATDAAIINKRLWVIEAIGGVMKPKTNNPIKVPSLTFSDGDAVTVTRIIQSDKQNVYDNTSLPTTKYVHDNIADVNDKLAKIYTAAECDDKFALKGEGGSSSFDPDIVLPTYIDTLTALKTEPSFTDRDTFKSLFSALSISTTPMKMTLVTVAGADFSGMINIMFVLENGSNNYLYYMNPNTKRAFLYCITTGAYIEFRHVDNNNNRFQFILTPSTSSGWSKIDSSIEVLSENLKSFVINRIEDPVESMAYTKAYIDNAITVY